MLYSQELCFCPSEGSHHKSLCFGTETHPVSYCLISSISTWGLPILKRRHLHIKMPAVCSFKTVSRLVPAEFGCNIILAVQDLRETHKMQRSPLLCVDDASPAGSGTESTYSEDEEDLNIFSYKKKHSPDIVCVCVLTLQYCSFTFSAHSWHTWLTNENSITTLDRHHWEHL